MNKKYIAIVFSMITLIGCSSRNSEINTPDNVLINDLETGEAVSQTNIIENLPKEQQDAELNKVLAQLRQDRKNGETIVNGTSISVVPNGADLPNQPQNMPEFYKESYESTAQLVTLTQDYVKNTLQIPERSYGYDIAPAIDPRINAIYDDADKGVAKGYTNENIIIYEYETEIDDTYSNLIMVRDNIDSPWKVIHHGNSYKE